MHLFCALILLVGGHLASSVNPNELKPCFERYDGFKIVNAVPFHSEWRMKAEEWCLEFCIRAASRCVSIVYDKYSHICHYFSVNGIEEEKISKHPRMVYFQVAERQCAARIQNKIDQEERWRQQQFEEREQNSTIPTEQPMSTTKTITESRPKDEMLFPEINQENVESTTPESDQQVNEATQQQSNEEAQSTTISMDPATLSQLNEQTSTQQIPIQSMDTSSHQIDIEYTTTTQKPVEETQTPEEEFDGDPMSFVKRFQFEKDGVDVQQVDPLMPTRNDKVVVPKLELQTEIPTMATQPVEETPTTTDKQPQTVEPIILTTQVPSTTQSSTTTTTQQSTTLSTSSTTQFKTTQMERRTTTPQESFGIPKLVDPMVSVAENAAAILPVISGFKAVRRPLPQMVGEGAADKKPEMIEVRRSPVKLLTSQQSSDHHMKYTGRRPMAQKMDPDLETITLTETPLMQAEDDETMLADNSLVVDDCSQGMQEVWLAVENSQVNSKVRTSVIKVATQPVECMEACQSLFIGKHPCDSFTFIEPAKRCIFHSSHSGFQVKPSALNDFSTRAFRRFCYSESLTPFSDCAEFLAFRDYTLDMPPREIFENLPLANEGISACIELCVLSHEFRCKSASFNTQNGTCMIFDEHSLSKPTHFKTNTDTNKLYFENGCIEMKIPESAVQQSKVQRVIQPVTLDYRKLSMH